MYDYVHLTPIPQEFNDEPRLLEKDAQGIVRRDRTHCIRFKDVHPDLYQECLNDNPNYQNTCATRMSYALNHGGYKITSGEFNDIYSKSKIFTSVIGITNFFKKEFKESDIKFNGSTLDFEISIADKKGIIIFVIKWKDATGHVTLWDGKKCVDGTDHFFDNVSDMFFWELK